MKKYLLLLIPILFLGCAEIYQIDIPRTHIIDKNDFGPYLEKGFRFIIGDYEGDYEVMGVINIYSSSGVKSYRDSTGYTYRKYIHPSPSTMMESMYSAALELSANGIMWFKIDYSSVFSEYKSGRRSYIYSGTAIKILDK